MLQKTGAGRNLDIDRGEIGRVIHAKLAWGDHATACGIGARGSAPVLKLCRLLVDAGHDPGLPLEAWRNGVLCLRVQSIGEAAGLRVAAHGVGFERIPECTAASSIDLNASDHAEVAPDWIEWPPDGVAE